MYHNSTIKIWLLYKIEQLHVQDRSPHDVKHIFECPAKLAVLDIDCLWISPNETANFPNLEITIDNNQSQLKRYKINIHLWRLLLDGSDWDLITDCEIKTYVLTLQLYLQKKLDAF